MKRIEFLNYPVDQLTMNEALLWIKAKSKNAFPHVITVINANKMWLANRNGQLRKILKSSDLVIPEYAVVWGARILKLPMLYPIYGVVLTKEFLCFVIKEHLRTFFDQDGRPKYLHNKTFPIDIHNVAQAIITLNRLTSRRPGFFEMAQKVASWAIENMQSPDGYFYYQVHRHYVNRIPYIRWGQAWMQIALTRLLDTNQGYSQ